MLFSEKSLITKVYNSLRFDCDKMLDPSVELKIVVCYPNPNTPQKVVNYFSNFD